MTRFYLGLGAAVLAVAAGSLADAGRCGPVPAADAWVNTFSLVAYDPDRKEWGVGVASKYLAVGAVVPWAKAGVGAVATQSSVNPTYGPRGLDLLAEGKAPADVVKA